jgi:hypothetical protein
MARGRPGTDGAAGVFGRRRDDAHLHGTRRAVAGVISSFDEELERSRRDPQFFDAIGGDLVQALEQRRPVVTEQRDADLLHAPAIVFHLQRELDRQVPLAGRQMMHQSVVVDASQLDTWRLVVGG